ncbi:copper resistance protein NlpE [Shewanella amazonensis]|uniref:Uncharacterized lipoprotein NlpE involved in copper resistance n=1 Tax=Shewanella amazonensis (strain ATCC BAA-1098 / SB2B) TaxID=326297 RepID=A1S7T3_SHEAM|nr:copper resistance protein NlpE [Shewanella amazonensis]ABM00440.1 uncharacterized lipoprotein NlpE involved in copper resistance [Shewanella amazonensis SB2B]
MFSIGKHSDFTPSCVSRMLGDLHFVNQGTAMKFSRYFFSLLTTLPLLACTQVEAPVPEALSQSTGHTAGAAQPQESVIGGSLPIGDSSRTSLDWQGSYEGVVPCASCEGIKTRLTLNNDGTYLLQSQYLGKEQDGKEPKVFEEQGKFSWNASGGAIQLENGAWYQVGENQLFMLDREGKRITGVLAGHYRLLKKQSALLPRF